MPLGAVCEHGSMDRRFHVLFVQPKGWSYEMWPTAAGEVEAVKTADDLLEYLERVGISDYLEADGVSVRGGAILRIAPDAAAPEEGLHLRITRPDGTYIER